MDGRVSSLTNNQNYYTVAGSHKRPHQRKNPCDTGHHVPVAFVLRTGLNLECYLVLLIVGVVLNVRSVLRQSHHDTLILTAFVRSSFVICGSLQSAQPRHLYDVPTDDLFS